eukprot:PITA_18704
MIPIDISVKPKIIENIHIGASCTDEEIQTYKTLFQEFHNVFAWSYEEMPGISPLHPIIFIGPFTKWGIVFITCNPHSAGGHVYIILVVDYFTKWAEAMPTFLVDGKTAIIFVFNHIISRFSVSQAIITDHGSHFRKIMMIELTDQLGLRHDSSTPYYPQANGLVKAIKGLVTMIQKIIELLPTTSEEEKHLLYLAQLDENRRDATLAIETHAKRIKAHDDQNVTPRNFSEGDLVLLYDQVNDKPGVGKFVPMWHGPFAVKHKLAKGAYELVDFDNVSLGRPRNGLYLKRYYS